MSIADIVRIMRQRFTSIYHILVYFKGKENMYGNLENF
jgi:hypothetical protein